MNYWGKQAPILLIVVSVSLIAVSCASGPPAPIKGTPAFYWSAAKETFTAGDYIKTSDHLGQLARSDNEFAGRARSWRLVLATGMAKGYMELADRFERGGHANRANPTPFRKQMSQYRVSAGQWALQAAETLHAFLEKNPEPKIALDFSYPSGSAAEIPPLNKIGQGILIQPAELESVEKQNVQKAVLLTACAAVGAADDTAKTQEVFKAGTAEAPRDTFLFAMANSLFDLSKLFARDKLDHPQRMKALCDEALEALKGVTESKKSKELKARIEKTLKQAKLL
ncbi:MAG: hypothetical protein AAB225_05925 [Acidobacteriota bacterium]